ncbi:MAG: transketolase [Spirochaetae bacterium HGW-Spirochaetae-2]|jgi:transketolase|nr:MAG: transketolase [Spirochaetae bacterium HGW-Spirochaetae-2]
MAYEESVLKRLRRISAQLRLDILEMIPPGKVGHLGGSSSIADVVAALYFHHMRVNPKDVADPKRDRLVFSKGHAVLAQYAALVELGIVDRSELPKVKTLDGVLQGHPDMDKTPGIEAVTGSLGQGLSISVGMALALRLDGSDSRVYTVCGDGELSEGQIWEAAMAADVFKLDNITAIVDWNGIQATGCTAEIFLIGKLADKWHAFGWNVIEIDGHDMVSILNGLESAKAHKGQPSVLLAKTVKGKGFSFAEGKAAFHNAGLTEEQFALGREEMRKMLQEVDA